MTGPSQATQVKQDKQRQHVAEPASVAETAIDGPVLAEWPVGPAPRGGSSVEAQAAQLGDPRMQGAQRQALAARIGRVQGNRHLQRVVASLERGEGVASHMLARHQMSGHRALRRSPHSEVIQAQPSADLPDDVYEREVGNVLAVVMRLPEALVPGEVATPQMSERSAQAPSAPYVEAHSHAGALSFIRRQGIYSGDGYDLPYAPQGSRPLTHELSSVVQPSRARFVEPIVQRRRGKRKKKPQERYYVFKVPITGQPTAQALLILSVAQILGMTRAQAMEAVKRGDWRWEKFGGITDREVEEGFARIGIKRSLYDALKRETLGKGEGERAEDKGREVGESCKKRLQKLSREERQRVIREVDSIFWQRTHYKLGRRLGRSELDRAMADIWRDICAEVLTGREKAKDKEVASKDLQSIRAFYDYLLRNFPDHVIFREGKATIEDLLQFLAENPDATRKLPSLSARDKATKKKAKSRRFLFRWQRHLGSSKGHPYGKASGSEKGHLYGEPGGSEKGVVKFEPKGRLIITPRVPKYVKGSNIRFRVDFDRSHPESLMMNYFPRRAKFDWTIMRNSKVYDTGPFMEGRGDIEYDIDLDKTGRYKVLVVVSSSRFKDNKKLKLESREPITVVKESVREKEVFEELFVGKEKPFERGRSGALKLKRGTPVLSVEEEIRLIDLQIGGITAKKGDIPHDDFDRIMEYLKRQKTSLEELRDKMPDKKSGLQYYLVRASFLSRETSAHTQVQAYMHQRKRPRRMDDWFFYSVMLYDTTLDPSNATQHPGVGSVHVAKGREKKGWAAAERSAIRSMMDHWHWYNDYPDGTIHVAIKLLESGKIYEKTIDTYNPKKSVKKALGVVAAVGGVIALAASPFTGGTSASVGVVLLKGAVVLSTAAGLAAMAIELKDRYEKEGTIKLDGRLALDILQLVSTVFGVYGSFSSALRNASALGKGMFVCAVTGLDVASGVIISDQVRKQIRDVEGRYGALILLEKDPEKKKKLERERDSAVTQIIGAAVVEGSFILVSTASGAHQIVSIGRMSGKRYTVREQYKTMVDDHDAVAIRRELEAHSAGKKVVTDQERAYLEEALGTIPPRATEAGGGAPVKPATPRKAPVTGKKPSSESYRDMTYRQLEERARKHDKAAIGELITRTNQRYKEPRPSDAKLAKMTHRELNKLARENSWAAGELHRRDLELKRELKAFRQRTGTTKMRGLKGKEGGGTLAVGKTDVEGLQGYTFEGASPHAGGGKLKKVKRGGKHEYLPESKFSHDKRHAQNVGHAEERLLRTFDQALEKLRKDKKWTRKQLRERLKGKTLKIYVEQEPCPSCKGGLKDPSKSQGPLAKFVDEYPELRLEVTDVESGETMAVTKQIRGK